MRQDILRHFLRSLVLSTGALGFASASEQVEIHLVGGQVVSGELVSEDAGHLTVKSSMPTKNGRPMSITKEYARSDISEVVRVEDPETAFATREAAAKTAADHTALATWCRNQTMIDRAVDHARKALAMDPKQDAAAKVLTDLGWIQVDDKWVRESEWLASQGKVRYEGKVMTIAEADAVKAQEKRKTEVKTAQQAVDDKTAALASMDRDIAKLPKRPAEIDAEIAKDTDALKSAQAAADRVTSTKAALAAAEKVLADAQRNQSAPSNARPGSGAGGSAANPAQNLAPLQQAVEDAQKAAIAARDDAAGSDREAARLKAAIVTLTEDKKNLDKKAVELKARRETLAKELEQARALLADATTKASQATVSP